MSEFNKDRRNALKRLSAIYVGTLFGSWLASAGCRTSPPKRRPTGTDLTPETRVLISEIAETIVPQTETPGAKAAGVDLFIVRVLADCRSQRERDAFLEGLEEFDQRCREKFGHSFIQCTPQQRLFLVEEVDGEAFGFWNRVKSKLFRRKHFFGDLKELVLTGYFTSRQGAGTLSYDPIPGKWIGCLKMKPGQKTWATQ